MTDSNLDHSLNPKYQLQKKICRDVVRYYKEHEKPISLNQLNIKYSRPARPYGGVHDLVEDLELKGIVRMEILKNASYLVHPIGGE